MNYDEVYKEWKVDGKIDETDVARAARNIPELHNKYYRWYVEESLKLRKLRADMSVLKKVKYEYYNGTLDEEELNERGWKPFALRVLKNDIDRYMEADADIINLSLRIGVKQEVVEYLESIVKQINNRNFVLKTIVDWNRFTSGG